MKISLTNLPLNWAVLPRRSVWCNQLEEMCTLVDKDRQKVVELFFGILLGKVPEASLDLTEEEASDLNRLLTYIREQVPYMNSVMKDGSPPPEVEESPQYRELREETHWFAVSYGDLITIDPRFENILPA